jgi:uncharacterized protein YecE (DUF72 family)
MHGDIRIGISGWRYAPWRKVFYPPDLTQKRELEFASRVLPTIEINGSFYGLQRPASYLAWYDQTPDNFVFSVKANRYVTHVLRLENVESAMANFFASGLFHLKEKLGPILWQFPPSLRFEPERFERFLALLPHDTEAAVEFAARHRQGSDERVYLGTDRKRPLRHAIEIRHKSFETPAFVDMLLRYKAALVIADTAGKWPYREDVTADFIYMRLHGAEELYASGYTDEALDRWARRIEAWSQGRQPEDAQLIADRRAPPRRKTRDVYCYFDNDIKVRAPFDARKLLGRMGLEKGLAPLQPYPGSS